MNADVAPISPRSPTVTLHRIGREGQPLVVIDDFASDPDALRVPR